MSFLAEAEGRSRRCKNLGLRPKTEAEAEGSQLENCNGHVGYQFSGKSGVISIYRVIFHIRCIFTSSTFSDGLLTMCLLQKKIFRHQLLSFMNVSEIIPMKGIL